MYTQSFYEGWHVSRKLQKRVIIENNFTYRFILSAVRRFGRGKEFLDIGCGVGTVDFFLATKGKHITGIDISKNAIKAASENARLFKLDRRVSFRVMNFPKEAPKLTYDFIICSEVLEHIPDESAAIARIYKLLRKKGRVFITTPSKNSLLFILGLAKKHDQRAGHLRRYSVVDLINLLGKNGFRVIYTAKREGILREALFIYSFGGWIVKVASKFNLISEIVTLLDNLLLNIFGGSQIFVVGEKE